MARLAQVVSDYDNARLIRHPVYEQAMRVDTFVNDECASDDGIVANEGDHRIRDGDSGDAVLVGDDVAEVAEMAFAGSRRTMCHLHRVEVPTRRRTPLRQVTEFVNVEALEHPTLDVTLPKAHRSSQRSTCFPASNPLIVPAILVGPPASSCDSVTDPDTPSPRNTHTPVRTPMCLVFVSDDTSPERTSEILLDCTYGGDIWSEPRMLFACPSAIVRITMRAMIWMTILVLASRVHAQDQERQPEQGPSSQPMSQGRLPLVLLMLCSAVAATWAIMNIRAKISLRLAQKAMDQAGLDNMKELVEDEVGASIIELQQRNDTSDKVVIEAGEPARANDRHFVVVPEPIYKSAGDQ
ncbi:hypothetical protein PBRA_008972 [Plasmodiophora brassicae]|nr:hypothetical protein PBRA_008972 [Plasmodiophora brassicae]